MRKQITCPECGKETNTHSNGLCNKCYRRLKWKRKLIKCKSCGRWRPHQAFGLCGGCHTRIYHYDKVKAYNAMKSFGLTLGRFNELREKCVVCGFDKVVELHHLDGSKVNGSSENLIGLCPNHHKMIHHYDYFEEIKQFLAEKGFDVTNIHPTNYVSKMYVGKKKIFGVD